MTPLNLTKFQKEVEKWASKNFGRKHSYHPLLGVVEEIGELCHAHLKQEQGIRGTIAEHDDAIKDAIGDAVVFLANYCALRGISLEEAIVDTWDEVKLRDWTRNKKDGKTKS